MNELSEEEWKEYYKCIECAFDTMIRFKELYQFTEPSLRREYYMKQARGTQKHLNVIIYGDKKMNDSEILNRLGIQVSEMASDILALQLVNANINDKLSVKVSEMELDIDGLSLSNEELDLEIAALRNEHKNLNEKIKANSVFDLTHIKKYVTAHNEESLTNLTLENKALKDRVDYLEDKTDKPSIEEPEKELKKIKLEVQYLFSVDCDPNHIRAKISPEQVEEIKTFGIDLRIKNQELPQEMFMKSLSRLGHLKIYYTEKNELFVRSIVGAYRMLKKEDIGHLLDNEVKIEIVP